ncbi:hypothetical protein SALBM311S_10649 [Streptomyces alboniger]
MLGRKASFPAGEGQAEVPRGGWPTRTGYDKSYLSWLESGERLSKVTVMEDLDGYYGCADLLVSLWKVARIDAFKDKYKEYMRLEATARIIWGIVRTWLGCCRPRISPGRCCPGPRQRTRTARHLRNRWPPAWDASCC